MNEASTFVFDAARWVSGDPTYSGEWSDEDRAFISNTRTLYPELESWGDAAIGFAWGGYSEDVLLLSWAHWIIDRHPPFLAYVYVEQVNPEFDFGRSGGWEAKLEELAATQPWLHAEAPLPAWLRS